MGKPVRTSPEADRQILASDVWWRMNRDNVGLFEQELADTIRLIETMPGAGKVYPHAEGLVRRMLMRETEHHVYYVEFPDHTLIVAVWGAIKGTGPPL